MPRVPPSKGGAKRGNFVGDWTTSERSSLRGQANTCATPISGGVLKAEIPSPTSHDRRAAGIRERKWGQAAHGGLSIRRPQDAQGSLNEILMTSNIHDTANGTVPSGTLPDGTVPTASFLASIETDEGYVGVESCRARCRTVPT